MRWPWKKDARALGNEIGALRDELRSARATFIDGANALRAEVEVLRADLSSALKIIDVARTGDEKRAADLETLVRDTENEVNGHEAQITDLEHRLADIERGDTNEEKVS